MTDHLDTAIRLAPRLKPNALGTTSPDSTGSIAHALIAIAERLEPPEDGSLATAIPTRDPMERHMQLIIEQTCRAA